MIIKKLLFNLSKIICLICLSSSVIAKTDSINIEPEFFTAKNGMRVCVLKSEKIPVVSHVLLYKVGSSDEPIGLSGMAHLLEHMMFKSVKGWDVGYYDNQLQKIGASYNAATDSEYTFYYATFPKEYLSMVMQLEAKRMFDLVIKEEELKKEKDVVLEERRQRVKNDETQKMFESLNSSLYINYPYAHPVSGWSEDIVAIKSDDLKNFYNNYYRPSNAILVLAGDVTKKDAERMVNQYYVANKDGDKNFYRINKTLPSLYGNVFVYGKDPKIVQNKLTRVYRTVSISMDTKGAIAADILGYIISGKRNSPLYKRLVVEKKVASDLDAGSYVFSAASGEFIFSIFPNDNVSLDELSLELDGFLADLALRGITSEQLQIAKDAIKTKFIYRYENINGIAINYARTMSLGLPDDFTQNYIQYIDNTSLEDLNSLLKNLVQQNFVEGHLISEVKNENNK